MTAESIFLLFIVAVTLAGINNILQRLQIRTTSVAVTHNSALSKEVAMFVKLINDKVKQYDTWLGHFDM